MSGFVVNVIGQGADPAPFRALGAVREGHDGYIATLTLVVDPTVTSPRETLPPMPAPGDHKGPPPGPPPGHGPHAALEGEARVAAMVPGVKL